jgi:hypothetical protein
VTPDTNNNRFFELMRRRELMSDPRQTSPQPDDHENEALKDLEIKPDDAETVKGGRRRSGDSADPCEGGE